MYFKFSRHAEEIRRIHNDKMKLWNASKKLLQQASVLSTNERSSTLMINVRHVSGYKGIRGLK
jgi:hypothetical protein